MAALVAISMCGTGLAGADNPTPKVALTQIVVCPITLSAARENLAARGYAFLPGSPDELMTDFKRSEHDTERYLLGSLAVERSRQYRVSSLKDGGIRFAVTIRETQHPHAEDRNARRTTRDYAPLLSEAVLPAFRDMRSEVCDPLASSGDTPDRRLFDYVAKRCKGGDDEACEALRPR